MRLLSGVYKDGVIEPLEKLGLKDGESVKIAIVSTDDRLVTNKTYRAIKISNHKLLESIIEETKYGNKTEIKVKTI
ncbi:DUF104 domain-containing protein [candidate division WOR-3 bacterium]|nr:DUF104 domain-containing protein [candidate division WOR-3 bacterium]